MIVADDLTIEIAPGADLDADPSTWTWVDITTRVRTRDGVDITGMGRGGESADADTPSLTIRVENSGGDFSSRNPLGEWYPDLGVGTPIRVYWDTDANIRFAGHISELPPRWIGDAAGSDEVAIIRADGLTRRLTQGEQALDSPLFRTVSSADNVRAYWPMEDGRDSTSFASPIAGVEPMFFSGDLDLAGSEPPPGSDGLPFIRPGGYFIGGVPSEDADGSSFFAGEWRVDWVARMDEEPPGDRRFGPRIYTSRGGTNAPHDWILDVNGSGQLVRRVLNDEGTQVFSATQSLPTDFFGRWHICTIRAVNGEARWSVRAIDGSSQSLDSTSTDSAFSFVGRVTKTGWPGGAAADPESRRFGHITVSDDFDADPFGTAPDGHAGELAAVRFERLCDEESIPVDIVGEADDSMPMGPQQIDNLTALLQEIEDTDAGVLSEADFGFVYRARAALYNQAAALTLSQPDGELASPPEPTDDDRHVRNDITANSPFGTSVRAVDEDHVTDHGRFAESVEINPETADQLQQGAYWRLHLGTVDEYRWPRIDIALHADPDLINDWLAVRVGDRLTVDHEIAQLAGVDIDLIVAGWDERFDQFNWDVTLNCVPAAPYTVAVFDSSRFDTAGSALDENINDSVTSFDVASDGQPWVNSADHASEFPFDVTVGGEVMTVSAISGSSSPQEFTVTRAVNGVEKSHSNGDAVRLATRPVFAL